MDIFCKPALSDYKHHEKKGRRNKNALCNDSSELNLSCVTLNKMLVKLITYMDLKMDCWIRSRIIVTERINRGLKHQS